MNHPVPGLFIFLTCWLLHQSLAMAGPAPQPHDIVGTTATQQCDLLASRLAPASAALRPCEQAAAHGDFGARRYLNFLQGVNPPLYAEALDAVQKGDGDAAGYLARGLLSGEVPTSIATPDQAEQLLRQAADAGNAEEQFELGSAFLSGKRPPINKNLKEAERFLRQAAEQGHSRALNALINLYLYHGVGTPEQALEWLRKAAPGQQNDNWGWVYEHGIGVAKDTAKAEQFYRASETLIGTFRGVQLIRQRPHSPTELQNAVDVLANMALIDTAPTEEKYPPVPHGDACRLLAALYSAGIVTPLGGVSAEEAAARWYGFASHYDHRQQ